MKKQTIIIFGGPDKCGKTTIAKEISRILEIPYFKPTGQAVIAEHTPNIFYSQTQWGEPKLLDFLEQTKYSAVIDRSFPCDWVYSKVLNRDTAWRSIEILDKAYAALDAKLIFTVKTASGYTRPIPDQWEKITKDVLLDLDLKYRDYARDSNIKSLILDTTDEDLMKQVVQILAFTSGIEL